MKRILILGMLFLVGCVSSPPAPTYHHPNPKPSVLPQADWSKTPPEEYDWQKYVDEGQSTVDTMARALHGIEVLQKRMAEILTSHRKLLASRSPEQLALFNEAQSKWKELADLETNFVAYGWWGGSGYKAARPSARLRLLHARVLRLTELKDEALDLNE
jgi:hypothetical protein